MMKFILAAFLAIGSVAQAGDRLSDARDATVAALDKSIEDAHNLRDAYGDIMLNPIYKKNPSLVSKMAMRSNLSSMHYMIDNSMTLVNNVTMTLGHDATDTLVQALKDMAECKPREYVACTFMATSDMVDGLVEIRQAVIDFDLSEGL